jgi:hypothetical protein
VIPITTTIDNGQNAVIVAKPTPVSAKSSRAAINNATLELAGPRSCGA